MDQTKWVSVTVQLTPEQVEWLRQVARANGQMSRPAAIRRLIDNAMRREAREQGEPDVIEAVK